MTAAPSKPAAPTPAMLAMLETEMEDAIASLDDTLRQPLIQAMEIVPNLVQTETERVKFLRREGFNPIKAARRLATYWKYRKEVFGNRWLLPMTQTGTGALNKKSVEIVRSGFISLVSSPSPVCVMDTSRLPRPLDGELNACTFYYGTIGSTVETQAEGVILLHIVTGRGPQNLDMATQRWNIIHDALPFKIREVLIVPVPESGKEYLLDFLSYQKSRLVAFRSGRQPEIIQAKSIDETVKLLEHRGLSIQCLPSCLGGKLDDCRIREWVQTRIRIEDSHPTSSVLSREYTYRGSTSLLMKRKKPPQEDKEAEKEYLRKRNALYSRRMYYKKKLEMSALPEQSKELQDLNTELKAENERLTLLLEEAQKVAADHQLAKDAPDDCENHYTEWESTAGQVWMSQRISRMSSPRQIRLPEYNMGRVAHRTSPSHPFDIEPKET